MQPGGRRAGSAAHSRLSVRIVDLSHHYADDMAVYPGLPRPSFKPIANVEEDGCAMSEYHLLNHIGTHIDAPSHQIAGGATLDEIPLERLVCSFDLDTTEPEWALAYRFDIVLGGPTETPFEE